MGNFSTVHDNSSSGYSSVDLVGEAFPPNFKQDYILGKEMKANVRLFADVAALDKGHIVLAVPKLFPLKDSIEGLLRLPVHMLVQGLDSKVIDRHNSSMKYRGRVIGAITGIAMNKRAAGQILYLKLRGDIENVQRNPSKIYGVEGLEKIQEVIDKYLATQEPIKYTFQNFRDIYYKDNSTIALAQEVIDDPEMITAEKVDSLWNVIREIKDLVSTKKSAWIAYKKAEKAKRSEDANAPPSDIPKDGLKPHTRAKIVRLTNEINEERNRLSQWEFKVTSLQGAIEHSKTELNRLNEETNSAWHWLLMIFSIGIYALIYYGEKERLENNEEIAQTAISETEIRIIQIQDEIASKRDTIDELKHQDGSDSDTEIPPVDGNFDEAEGAGSDEERELEEDPAEETDL